MADQDNPTRASNMEKAEGDRRSEWGEGTSEGAGASNRPMGEEAEKPDPVMPADAATVRTKI
jgi:hypothetical protein